MKKTLMGALGALLAISTAQAQTAITSFADVAAALQAGSKTNPLAYGYTARALSRLAASAATNNPRALPAMTTAAWAASTQYSQGDLVTNGGNTYEQVFGTYCTSAGSGGPSGTSGNIVDNSCVWRFAPGTVVANAAAPTIVNAGQWGTSVTYKTGATTVVFSGSGATAVGNFYTNTAAGTCTTASSGGGPTGTGTGITDGTCTWNFLETAPTAIFGSSSANSVIWNAGAGSLLSHVNVYGGTTVNSGGTNYMEVKSTTVNGSFSVTTSRIDFMTNAQKIVLRSYDQNGQTASLQSAWRIIVCNAAGENCQYVNARPYSLTSLVPSAGWARTILDFSASGNYETREIIIENDGGSDFGGIDVSATDDVYQPGGKPVVSMAVSGDSYPIGGGLMWGPQLAFPEIVGDYLGIKNVINTAIGGCGYITSCSSGTALSRLSDVTQAKNGACPDVLMAAGGTNDVAGSTPAQIATAVTTYIQAFQSACGNTVPIFVTGIWAHNYGGASYTAGVLAEQAIQAAVAALGNTQVVFLPVLTDPTGAWQTGTGTIGAAVGTATFATNVMTVTATTSGTWQIGEVITAAGVTGGTTITSFGTGTGGNGTYNLSTSPGTIGSEAVTANAQNGTGNTDFSVEGQGSPQNLHPNAVGNRIFATRILGGLRRWFGSQAY